MPRQRAIDCSAPDGAHKEQCREGQWFEHLPHKFAKGEEQDAGPERMGEGDMDERIGGKAFPHVKGAAPAFKNLGHHGGGKGIVLKRPRAPADTTGTAHPALRGSGEGQFDPRDGQNKQQRNHGNGVERAFFGGVIVVHGQGPVG